MRFRPCIDLHDGKVKQIVGSTLDCGPDQLQTNFEAELDSSYYAQMYQRDGLSGAHVIMLGGGNKDAARRALAAWPGHLQIGGGITCENALEWLEAGASQVIVTSTIFRNGVIDWDTLKRLSKAITPEKLVLDLSCRRQSAGGEYYIVTDRWRNFTSTIVNKATLEELAEYCSEFLVHAVDVEGKQSGMDLEILRLLGEKSPIKCVYAGGIRALEDIEKVYQLGQGKVDYTIGSALDIFGGALPYQSVVKLDRKYR